LVVVWACINEEALGFTIFYSGSAIASWILSPFSFMF
jgi:hypothetical protein